MYPQSSPTLFDTKSKKKASLALRPLRACRGSETLMPRTALGFDENSPFFLPFFFSKCGFNSISSTFFGGRILEEPSELCLYVLPNGISRVLGCESLKMYHILLAMLNGRSVDR